MTVTVVPLVCKDRIMKINRILALTLFCSLSLFAMQEEEVEPIADARVPVAVSMEHYDQINVTDQLRSLSQNLQQAYHYVQYLSAPFVLERYKSAESQPNEHRVGQKPVVQLYQTLARSRELFSENMINLAVDLLWDAQNKKQEHDIQMFSQIFARLEIAGSATMSDEQLSSIQFRESGLKEAVEERAEELFDIFRYKDSKESLQEKLKARIKVLPIEQRPELYICLKHFLRDIDAAIIVRNVKDDDIRREWQQLAVAKEQIVALSERMLPYVRDHLRCLEAINEIIIAIRKHFRKYIPEGIESDRYPQYKYQPLSNADRNLVREIDAFFQLTQETIEINHKGIDGALREFAQFSADVENIQRQIEKLCAIKGALNSVLLPQDDPRYNEHMEAIEREQDAKRQKQGAWLLQRLGQGALSVAKKAALLVGAFAQSLSPQYRTIDAIPQELTTIQGNITTLIERLSNISQKFRSAALSEKTVIEDLCILSKIFDLDDEGHQGARIKLDAKAWENIHNELKAKVKICPAEFEALGRRVKIPGQNSQADIPVHDRTRRFVTSDQEQSFHIPYQEEIEQSMAKKILASSFRTQVVKGLLTHILRPSKPGQGIQILPMVGIDSVIKSMFPEDESQVHQVEELETQSSFIGRVTDGVRSLAHPSNTLLRGVGRAIEEQVPELPQILAHPHGEQGYMQPNASQTFDDHYTTMIIGTRNIHYILYDLAARTRFNTGRFSYLIRPLVHMIEEKMEGPLNIQEGEKPGDRYHGIMRALSDEATPLEHPWLLFSIPPRAVGLVETVLRVANADGKGFPEVEQQQPSAAQDRLKSTSFDNLVWNIAKRVAARPFGAMAKWVKKSCISFGNGVKQCAQCAYAPFKKPLEKGQEGVSVFFKSQLKKHPSLAHMVERLKSKSYSAWREYATPQGIAQKIRALFPIGIVGTLERYMREKRPASQQLALLQNFIANHHLEVFTDTMVAAISHNSQRIRDFANRYLRIQRIDPITEGVIHNARLRSDLGSFAEVLPPVQQWHQNQETGEWTVQRVAVR